MGRIEKYFFVLKQRTSAGDWQCC